MLRKKFLATWSSPHLLKSSMRISPEVTIPNMVSPQVFGQKISTRLINWRKDSKPEQYRYCHNIFEAGAPFGGYKRSGFGREVGIHVLEN